MHAQTLSLQGSLHSFSRDDAPIELRPTNPVAPIIESEFSRRRRSPLKVLDFLRRRYRNTSRTPRYVVIEQADRGESLPALAL